MRESKFDPPDGNAVQVPIGLVFPQRPPASETADITPKAKSHGMPDLLKWACSFPSMLGMGIIGRVFYQGRTFLVDPDLWWHIKVGQDIQRTHHFPTTDPYSFTVSGAPWIAYEWLGELVLGYVARLGGIVALDAFLIGLGSAIMIALYYYATLRSGNCKAGFVSAGLLCSLAFASFTLRPQMLGYLFLVLFLIALEKFRRGVTWPVYCLPLLMLVWVNTHGSFIIGIGVLVLYLLCGLRQFQLGSIEAVAWSKKQRLTLEGVLLLCVAVLPITPYETQLAIYPFNMAFQQPVNLKNILEWKPISFDEPGAKIFLAMIVGFIFLQVLLNVRWRPEEMLLLLGGTVMACLHVRFLLLFVPFFAPIFATLLARLLPPYKRAIDHFVLNAAFMTAMIAAMIHYAPSRDFLKKIVNKSYPVGAVAYIEKHSVAGPLWDTHMFGGYLVGAGRRVFIDGRGDLYERGGVLSDYVQLTQFKPGALSVLDRYRVNSCLLERGEPLATVLLALPGWERVYMDETSSLFVRTQLLASPATGKQSDSYQ